MWRIALNKFLVKSKLKYDHILGNISLCLPCACQLMCIEKTLGKLWTFGSRSEKLVAPKKKKKQQKIRTRKRSLHNILLKYNKCFNIDVAYQRHAFKVHVRASCPNLQITQDLYRKKEGQKWSSHNLPWISLVLWMWDASEPGNVQLTSVR